MEIITIIFKLIGFVLDLYKEKDKKKAEAKAEIGKELIDALKQTNKKKRTSAINSVVVKLRK